MTKLSKIEVPLVQDDLKYSETLVQIANTLDILNQAVRNVFSHVDQSIGKTRQTLRSLETRNEIVCDQIERLKTIQKSVTIRSKGKYPYESGRGDNYRIEFSVEPKLEFPRSLPRASDSSIQQRSVSEKSESQSRKSDVSSDIENKLKFYHVKTDDMLRKNVELVCEESLGRLPSNVDSITACLLFNTSDNVYERYVIVDPLSTGNPKPPPPRPDSIQTRKMEDAPKSLNTEDNLLLRRQSFAYSPSVEAAPVIELPADLPDLVGFADDFRYTGDAQDFSSPILPPPVRLTEHQQTPPPTLTAPAVPVVTPPSVLSTLSPPSSVPPPPAPPPPPLPPPASGSPTPTTSSPPTTSLPPSSSLHANLMEAIRSAGGTGKAKLRTVAVDKEPNAVNSSAGQSAALPSGDLMSDLAAKLSLRRKGISGTQQTGGKEGGTLMDKLLASIPPPPAPGLTAGSSSGSEPRSDAEAEWDD